MGRKPKSTAKPKVDPELMRQLAAVPAEGSVQAVYTLRTPAGEKYRSADSTREAVARIIDAAATTANARPQRVNIFPNAQSFAISGPPALVRTLLEDRDIATAMANVQQEDILIRPVQSKRKAKKK